MAPGDRSPPDGWRSVHPHKSAVPPTHLLQTHWVCLPLTAATVEHQPTEKQRHPSLHFLPLPIKATVHPRLSMYDQHDWVEVQKILSTAPLGFQEKIHIPEFRWVLAPLRWETSQICVFFSFYWRNLAAHVRASHTRLRKRKCQRSNHIWWFFAGGCQRVLHGPAIFCGFYWQLAGRIPPDNHIWFRCNSV